MAQAEGGKAGEVGETPTRPGAGALESLQRDLEELGLNRSEARVVVALVQVERATGSDLARLSGVPRTAVYPVLDQLRAKGLVETLPGSPTIVSTVRGEDVLARLYAAQQARLQSLEATVERARQTMSEVACTEPSANFSSLTVLRGLPQMSDMYLRLVSEAQHEVLVCNRGPYGRLKVQPAVLEMLDRGVAARALYEAPELEGAESETFRDVVAVYHAAGVQGRVVDRLPLGFAVVDAEDALFALQEQDGVAAVRAVPVHISHPDFASALVALFEHHWGASRPYPGDPGARIDLRGSKGRQLATLRRTEP